MTRQARDDPARAARVLRQHAEDIRLLSGDGGMLAGVPLHPAKPGPAATPVVASEVEAKPAKAGTASVADRTERELRMDALRAKYEADAPHQHFLTDHTQIVWGNGDVCARLMFVGEAPGAEEDKVGKPFVGRSGQLLDKMIGAMGLSREAVYIANVLKTRPPNNATPTIEEASVCTPYLLEQISIVSPEVIVTLGRPAAQALLQTTEAMGKLRGRWHGIDVPTGALETRSVPVMPTYHPAYVLRNYTDDTRSKVWSDLKMAMERLGLAVGG
ncbi:MAG: uracil-DNA glycosylase [Planctomycetota bacterium]